MGKSNGIIALGLFFNPLVTGFLALYSWRFSIFYLYLPTCFTLLILTFTDLTEKFFPSAQPVFFCTNKRNIENPIDFYTFRLPFSHRRAGFVPAKHFRTIYCRHIRLRLINNRTFLFRRQFGHVHQLFFLFIKTLAFKKFPQILLCCCLCTTSILLFLRHFP